MISRFASSTTGEEHPGTLLSALLIWLDARARGGRVLLRLEDLDVPRARPRFATETVATCTWLGLDWDEILVQSASKPAHEAALDRLAAAGRLYPCACSRTRGAAGGRRAPGSGWAYDNTCRGRPLAAHWSASTEPLRLRLDDDRVELVDEGRLDLSQTPARDLGDPIVRRRDGVIAHHLAVVVDDAASGITDVVRGRDMAPATATQVLIQRALGLPTPRYHHHFLLLDQTGAKLAKVRGSIPAASLRAAHDGPTLCAILAHAADLADRPRPWTPAQLVGAFTSDCMGVADRIARFTPETGLVTVDDRGVGLTPRPTSYRG